MDSQDGRTTEAKSSFAAPRGRNQEPPGVVGLKVSSGSLDQEQMKKLMRCYPEVERFMDRAEPNPIRPLLPEGQPQNVKHDGTPQGEVVAMARLFNAFGTGNPAFLAVAVSHLEKATRVRGVDRTEHSIELDAGVALVRSVDPQSELEAALAVQMASTHTLSMEMLEKARHTDDHDRLNAYVTNAAKLSRTFTAQMEALGRLRGAGRQMVEVTHTHIDARGSQNVIGDVTTRGDGGASGKLGRPHAPAALPDAALAVGLPLRSQDEERGAVPVASGAREEAMPDARRRRPRRSKGAG